MYKTTDGAVSDLRPGEARPVDERGALSVSFRVYLWPSNSVGLVQHASLLVFSARLALSLVNSS
jgi:hypothetical protein